MNSTIRISRNDANPTYADEVDNIIVRQEGRRHAAMEDRLAACQRTEAFSLQVSSCLDSVIGAKHISSMIFILLLVAGQPDSLTSMKTIVALVDLSDLTFKVLKQAHHLASAFQSEVIILNVVGAEPVMYDIGIGSPTIMQPPSPESVQQQYAQLTEMRDSLAKFGVNATVDQMFGASIETVLDETRKLNADLIIIGSHRHSTFYKLLIGSATEDVLKRAHCPVLVVPSDPEAK